MIEIKLKKCCLECSCTKLEIGRFYTRTDFHNTQRTETIQCKHAVVCYKFIEDKGGFVAEPVPR